MKTLAPNTKTGKPEDAFEAAVSALLAAVQVLSTCRPADTGRDPWVIVVVYLAGIVPRREANLACASGSIVGAAKPGKQWVARQSAVDAWLESMTPRAANDASDDRKMTADDYVRRWREPHAPRRSRKAGGAK